eukprot:m.12697 g.12697  ORF g.12697 m.12697 type:complete len:124 (+) comp7000_c0_seq2:1657-2028(+)
MDFVFFCLFLLFCFSFRSLHFSLFSSPGGKKKVRIWDLRKQQCVYTLPAHHNLVSGLRYHESGNFFVTCSYDQTAKVWTAPGCAPLKVLQGHEGKVMSIDVSNDAKFIATSAWDRTFKLWTAE